MNDFGVSLTAAMLNTESVQGVLKNLSGAQAREAYAAALTDAGFLVRRAMQAEIRSQFDRPTAWIVKAPKVFKATPDKLEVAVAPTLTTDYQQFMSGGKIGVDPQHVLQAQTFGGMRRDKRSESVLKNARLLPPGYQTAMPSTPFPGSDDGRGNFRAGFLTRLFSYLQAFGEQGYRANITDKSAQRRKDIQSFSVLATRRQVRLMDGWEFFVSAGKGSLKNGRESFGGRRGMRMLESTRKQNLAAGIWARQGKTLRMVVAFIKPNSGYMPRLNMERIAQAVDVQSYLDRRVRYRVRQIAGD